MLEVVIALVEFRKIADEVKARTVLGADELLAIEDIAGDTTGWLEGTTILDEFAKIAVDGLALPEP